MMGDGAADIRGIRALVEAAGFHGMVEVEILSNAWWRQDPDQVLETVKARFAAVV